jgi:hypothetical protein
LRGSRSGSHRVGRERFGWQLGSAPHQRLLSRRASGNHSRGTPRKSQPVPSSPADDHEAARRVADAAAGRQQRGRQHPSMPSPTVVGDNDGPPARAKLMASGLAGRRGRQGGPAHMERPARRPAGRSQHSRRIRVRP